MTAPSTREGAVAISATRHRVTVLIADADPAVRRRLRLLLEAQPDFDVVGEADRGELAMDLARMLRPELLLLDGQLPSVASHEFATAWKAEFSSTRLVILTKEGPSPDGATPEIASCGGSPGHPSE